MTINFISGHLDLTKEEFNKHYKPLLDAAIDRGEFFIVGDARGADFMAQEYLAEQRDKNLQPVILQVFHMFEKPRNCVPGVITFGGFISDDERDTTMTVVSNKDIAWVRPGREKSGTAKNLDRRKRLKGGLCAYEG
jgi:hypothetical protein